MDRHRLIDCLLAGNSEIGFELDRIVRKDFEDELLRPLHQMSNVLMQEPYGHFCRHANTNDVLHVFRRRGSREIEGFQFWRAVADPAHNRRVVLGGKLRIRPESRRRALHLISGLSILHEERLQHPGTQIVRTSVASLFGMVSIAKRLASYDFIDSSGPRADLVEILCELMAGSSYRFDPETSRVDVGIFVTDSQLRGYPPGFFEGREARAYIERNPDFRTNGCYLAFAFDADANNVAAILSGIVEIVAPTPAVHPELLTEFLAAWPQQKTAPRFPEEP